MFEKITEKRIREASSVIDKLRDYSYESVINSDLSEFLINFIISESSNYGSKESLLKSADRAVKLFINYTLRPRWTLLNYIFGNVDAKPSAEILRKVEIFTFYHYYLELIRSVAADSEQISVKRITVESALESVNRDIYEKLTTDISSLKIKNLFVQVFRLKYGDNTEISLDMSVPFYFIKLFLDDKEYNGLYAKFGKSFSDTDEVELKTIIKILSGKYSGSDIPEPLKSDEVFTHKQETFTERKKPAAETATEEQTPEPLKAEETIKADEKPLQHHFVETHANESNLKETPSIKTEIKEPEIKREVIEETPPAVPVQAEDENVRLKYLFKEEEIKNISKKVFKGRKHLMMESLLEIEKLPNWRETTGYLKKVFLDNRVNYYDKSVILFVDILSDYFEKKEN
ncbi:MAG: hypothetical protein LWX07_02355 [Bacteroidetes bacterium]|nr:hypothetical protein [Bacteroidota bacterium]